MINGKEEQINMGRSKDLLISILEKAIKNELTLIAYYDLCEDALERDEIAEQILDNIESFLEHAPDNWDDAKNRAEYDIMVNDLKLLHNSQNLDSKFLIMRRRYSNLK